MSLRNKMTLLLSALAVYAVAVAGLTIYATRWRVESAVASFEQAAGQTSSIDQLILGLEEQTILLREVLKRGSEAIPQYAAARDNFSHYLQGVSAFSFDSTEGFEWSEVLALANELEAELNRVLQLADAGQEDQALAIVSGPIENDLRPRLRAALTRAKRDLSVERNSLARGLADTASLVFVTTLMVGLLAAALVAVGAKLVQVWLFRPLQEIRSSLERHAGSGGAVVCEGRDELEALQITLTQLAQNLSASERKYRSLFANLQDGVVICDAGGRILEYHDGAPRVLGLQTDEHVGKHLLEVWPEWREAAADWSNVFGGVIAGRRFQFIDVCLPSRSDPAGRVFFDFIVYGFEAGDARRVAVVVRDVTERNRLQGRLRRAEALEAVGAMAGAFAHDLNNLLASVMGTLSRLKAQFAGSADADRIDAALRTCRRAAGLSKRLLNYASGAQGTPQVFCPSEILETILESMDPAFVNGMSIEKSVDPALLVHMDQDQFAQIALNLLRNAREAMDGHGRLRISFSRAVARDPDRGEPERPFVLFAVQDGGVGMSREVQARLFEPFFSTKSPSGSVARGLGLSIVHTAVVNAGGFVQVESAPGAGSTFRVYLPLVEGPMKPAGPGEQAGSAAIRASQTQGTSSGFLADKV